MMTDPLADMLTRMRNALAARHEAVDIPTSKLKVLIAQVLKDEGFVKGYEVAESTPRDVLKVVFSYDGRAPVIKGLRRVSKPGLRLYCRRGEIPRVLGGRGIAILSTSQGVLTGSQAYRQRLGGEILCYVW